MTDGFVTRPATLKEMYLPANQWLKTTGSMQSGLASTFIMKLNTSDLTHVENRRGR